MSEQKSVDEEPGIGAAIATWGPLALIFILIVVFRAGDDAAAKPRASEPKPNVLGEVAAPAGDTKAMPSLEMPSSKKLIEEMTQKSWAVAGEKKAPPAVAPTPAQSGAPAGGQTDAPVAAAPGAVPGGVQGRPAWPGATHGYPRAGPPPGAWGPRDPAVQYWGAPPQASGQARPTDPYWWAGQQPSMPPPSPSRPQG